MDERTSYFFGCVGSAGHFLFDKQLRQPYKRDKDFPCPVDQLDGGFLPPYLEQEQGKISACFLNGWTILAWWDRSVDHRGGSNAAYIVRGQYHSRDALRYFKEDFPSIFARFPYELH